MTHKAAPNPAIRNIAIITHVDHGKTTLVDAACPSLSSSTRSIGLAQDRVYSRREKPQA